MAWQKYNNKNCYAEGGRSFDSKGERDCGGMLERLKDAGQLTEIKYQVQIHLTDAKILYKPDFEVTNSEGETYWVEYKGMETPTWRIKRRLWKAYGPGRLEVWKKNSRGLFLFETITPK